MKNIFKKNSPTDITEELSSLLYMLDIFYKSSPEKLYDLKPYLRFRVSLFTYGVIDSYCRAKEYSDKEAMKIFAAVSPEIKRVINFDIRNLLNNQVMSKIFADSFLVDIISIGGNTYIDFLAGEKQKGGMSLTRFGSLIGMWQEIPVDEVEKQILANIS